MHPVAPQEPLGRGRIDGHSTTLVKAPRSIVLDVNVERKPARPGCGSYFFGMIE